MQLLVTRPQPQADEWVQALRARGVPARALPLIAIAPQPGPAVREAWQRLHQAALVVFVSPGAVTSFFAARPDPLTWPAHGVRADEGGANGVRAGAVGPGTSHALRVAGVPPQLIVEPAADAAQFDSEALWQRLAGERWAQRAVWIVRGDGGRDWLAEQLRAHGAEVSFVQAYRRALPQLDGCARQLLAAAVAEPAHTRWLFSSSQAIDHLRQLAPAASWAAAHALATHPRIAEAARAAGFGHVASTRPGLDAVQAAWGRSIQSTASSEPDAPEPDALA
ncbi:MAG: uroporphyrinogen-III synthase [Ideonella sp.]|nr:uroporphyrinogen-III synthase [Ideonella sp.]